MKQTLGSNPPSGANIPVNKQSKSCKLFIYLKNKGTFSPKCIPGLKVFLFVKENSAGFHDLVEPRVACVKPGEIKSIENQTGNSKVVSSSVMII